MDQCAKSERCISDARRSLYRWGIEPSEHNVIIERLTAEKFIDESRYASAYAREKSNLNRWGKNKIKANLRAKSIPAHIIEEALSRIDTEKDSAKLEDHLRRKLRTVKYRNGYDLRGKLLRYGTGLGFDYRDVTDAIEKITADIPAEED